VAEEERPAVRELGEGQLRRGEKLGVEFELGRLLLEFEIIELRRSGDAHAVEEARARGADAVFLVRVGAEEHCFLAHDVHYSLYSLLFIFLDFTGEEKRRKNTESFKRVSDTILIRYITNSGCAGVGRLEQQTRPTPYA
jgi:hypothetical protein